MVVSGLASYQGLGAPELPLRISFLFFKARFEQLGSVFSIVNIRDVIKSVFNGESWLSVTFAVWLLFYFYFFWPGNPALEGGGGRKQQRK